MPAHWEGGLRRREEDEVGTQDGGNCLLRRCVMERKEANDQVKLSAEIGVPGAVLRNCSASEPEGGVYFCTTETKLSA